MKFILFTILLTVIYSWDDLTHSAAKFVRRLFRFGHFRPRPNADEFVGSILLLFAMPLSMVYFLQSPVGLESKLGWLAIQMILIAVLASGAQIFVRRLRTAGRYQGWEHVSMSLLAVAGMFSSTIRTVSHAPRTSYQLIAKFAALLSLPALAGWILAKISPRDIVSGEILPNQNSLLIVLVGGIIILITADILEKHFRVNKYKIEALVRIIIGIAVIFIISEGLV